MGATWDSWELKELLTIGSVVQVWASKNRSSSGYNGMVGLILDIVDDPGAEGFQMFEVALSNGDVTWFSDLELHGLKNRITE